MTPKQALEVAILPGLTLLAPKYSTLQAQAMLLAIALQESVLCHRVQIRGPARSIFQFEVSGIRGVLDHPASRNDSTRACQALIYPVERTRDGLVTADTVLELHRAVRDNDVLAAALARLVLWRLPAPLPGRDEPAAAGQQYLECWRPGQPHMDRWDDNYATAWAAVV